MLRRSLLALLPLAAATPLAAQDSVPALQVAPCTIPNLNRPARCGTLQVWENRQAKSGRKIAIAFVVVPATGGAAAKDAVAPLAGGPGQAVIPGAAYYARELAPVNREHDVVLVDQRGAGGKSHPLNCRFASPDTLETYLGAYYPPDRAAACAAELARTADLQQYTTDAYADDLDEVRAALGYETLSPYGTSYGTRAALVYARRHPGHVRAILLHGVFPVDERVPSKVAPGAQRALDGVLAECEQDAACAAAYPHVRDDLRAALARLAAGPVAAQAMDPATGGMVQVRLTRDLFAEGIRYLTYGAGDASLVPLLIHQAAQGDFGPAADQALVGRRFIIYDQSGGDGLYLTSTCSEDVPFFDEAEGVRAAEGTFLGAYRVRDQKAVCRVWPVHPVDASFLQPVRSDAPVLVLSGQWDPVTPPANAEHVLETLPNGRHVIIPHGGHGFDGLANADSCITAMENTFLVTADPKAVDATCVARIQRHAWPTTPILTRPIAISPAEMQAYTGSYGTANGPHLDVAMEDGHLAVTGFGRHFLMIPVAPDRFRLPAGLDVYLVFARTNGQVSSLAIEESGHAGDSFPRIH